ncbi:MAG: hypothetical protein R3E86_11085 [Pseudomonadales bacterium]
MRRTERHRTQILSALTLIGLLLAAPASAGIFDKIKQKAREIVQEAAPELPVDEIQLPGTETAPDQSSPSQSSGDAAAAPAAPHDEAGSQPSTPQPGKAVAPPAKSPAVAVGASAKSEPLINSTDWLMQRWPYVSTEGSPVRDVVLRGAYLGQPLPEAHRALLDEGFSYVSPGPLSYNYSMLLIEAEGQQRWVSSAEQSNLMQLPGYRVIRRLSMTLHVAKPSAEMRAELPAYPGNGSPAAMPPTMQDKESRYVSGIEYAMAFMGGETVNWDALREQAKTQYGTPNYSAAAAAGKVQGYSAAHSQPTWVDAGLLPRDQIAHILDTAQPEPPYDSIRQMLWYDLFKPGMTQNLAYNKQISGGLDNIIAALRVAGAPYMVAGPKNSAFAITLQWDYLKNERSVRDLYAKDQAMAAQPEAKVTF